MPLPPFRDPTLLQRALTHRSYINEHPDAGEDNERLEFLGDAVLDFIAGSFLFHRYPKMAEGQLTRLRSALVRMEQLAALAEQFELGQALRLGKGEVETGGRTRPSMLADAFEALIGALFLDVGLEVVRKLVEPLFASLTEQILKNENDQDAKSYLQEIAQAEYRHTPAYQVIAAEGLDHERTFTVQVSIGGKVFGTGRGRSKGAATQAAAKDALQHFSPRHLLITGASGYLGAHLLQSTRYWQVTGTYFSRPLASLNGHGVQLDLTDAEAVQRHFSTLRPTVIIHAACSNRGDLNAIVSAARNVAMMARMLSAHLIHISTDLVFDGEHPPYGETTRPSPVMDYGKAKAEAEAVVTELCPDAVIVRPSLIWGLQPLDHQTRWLVEAAKNNTPVTLFTDEIRCPIHISDLCQALLELATKTDISGPLHLVGPQALNRWQFGQRLLKALHLPLGSNITAGTVVASGLVRARNLTLSATRAQQLLKTHLRSVDEVLNRMR